jgi:N-acetylglutamate synthase-like GNAT family acetyltransferase
LRPYQRAISTDASTFTAKTNLRFPAGYLSHFEAALEGGKSTFLVFEDHQQVVVGCGGIGIETFGVHRGAVLCFGLVDPARHCSGIGSALLLGRLVTLPESDWTLVLFAVASSRGFYERFRFRHLPNVVSAAHSFVYRATMFLSDQRDCRYLLESADIDLRLDWHKSAGDCDRRPDVSSKSECRVLVVHLAHVS